MKDLQVEGSWNWSGERNRVKLERCYLEREIGESEDKQCVGGSGVKPCVFVYSLQSVIGGTCQNYSTT